MSTPSKDRSAFFNARAGDWEDTCYPANVRTQLCALINEFGIAQGERVLDVGTGPGVLIPYLRDLVKESGRVCAFDLSYEMVKQACLKPRFPVDTIVQANVHSIPFTHNVFDRVICFAAFPHFDHPERAVREMVRVLKHGGTLIIAHLKSREELSEHHGKHRSVASDVLPDDQRMSRFFTEAKLSRPTIINLPGRYLAKGLKNENR